MALSDCSVSCLPCIVLTTELRAQCGTYDEVADDHREQKERNAMETTAEHAVPGGLNPLATQHTEYDHERVKEVYEVPARYSVRKMFLVVVDSEHLTAHYDDHSLLSPSQYASITM